MILCVLCVLSGESTWSKGRYSGPDPLTDNTIGNPVTERDTRAARGNLIEVNGIGAAGQDDHRGGARRRPPQAAAGRGAVRAGRAEAEFRSRSACVVIATQGSRQGLVKFHHEDTKTQRIANSSSCLRAFVVNRLSATQGSKCWNRLYAEPPSRRFASTNASSSASVMAPGNISWRIIMRWRLMARIASVMRRRSSSEPISDTASLAISL